LPLYLSMELISVLKNFTYRTEVYLQQRENQLVNKSPAGTITTWKNLKYQKQIFDDDQMEIDRVLSTIDSIHGTFNRSSLIPYRQIYSSLYGGGDDDSSHLIKTFCQRQDHLIKDDEKNSTNETTSSFGNFHDTDSDSIHSDEEGNERKHSYDSGYGSVMPKRYFSRESLVDFSQKFPFPTNSLL
jgi:hypothetical protein